MVCSDWLCVDGVKSCAPDNTRLPVVSQYGGDHSDVTVFQLLVCNYPRGRLGSTDFESDGLVPLDFRACFYRTKLTAALVHRAAALVW